MLPKSPSIGSPNHNVHHASLHLRHNAVKWVTDYGAVGNGIADDTKAIQAGIDAVRDAGGGPLIIPAGTYLISGTLNVHWRVTLQGFGRYVSGLKAASAIDGAVLKIYDEGYTGHIELIDLGIDGNSLAQHGILLEHTSNNQINGVRIENCVQHGLHVTGGVWCCGVTNSIFKGCQNGIYITAPPTTVGQANINTYQNCNITGCMGAGIRLLGGTSQRILNCDIEHNGLGGDEQYGIYQTGGGQNLIVFGCHFERNGLEETHQGVNVSIGNDKDGVHLAPLVTGCYMYGGGDHLGRVAECNYAIRIENTSGAVLTSNRAWGHNLAAVHQSGSNNLDVTQFGNFFNNNNE
jgi:hypothetical protein